MAQLVKNPSAMWETWVQSLGWEDPLEEGIATHSSVLAWRTLMDRGAWQATIHGSQRVGQDWSDLAPHVHLSLRQRLQMCPWPLPTSVTLRFTARACLMENLKHTSEPLSTQCPAVNWLDLESEINHILRKSYPKRLLCLWSEVLIPTMQNSHSLPRRVKVLSWEQEGHWCKGVWEL